MPLIPLVAVALQVAPAPSVQEADLRCIAAITAAIGSMPETDRATIVPLAIYYIGRATGRDPAVDLERELVRIIGDGVAFGKAAPADLQRCAKEMEAVGAQLQRLGTALTRRAGAK